MILLNRYQLMNLNLLVDIYFNTAFLDLIKDLVFFNHMYSLYVTNFYSFNDIFYLLI